MKQIASIFSLIFLLVLGSCARDSKSNENNEFKYFQMENIGWKSKSINRYLGEINYTATEVPIAYYILKELGKENLNTVDSVYNSNKTERVLEIEFHHDQEKDLLMKEFTNMSYEEAIKYMAFNMEKDFKIITSKKDTIQCSGVHFERNFKIAPFKRALLYFGNIEPEETIQLVYNDELFGNGIVKFKFNNTPIKL